MNSLKKLLLRRNEQFEKTLAKEEWTVWGKLHLRGNNTCYTKFSLRWMNCLKLELGIKGGCINYTRLELHPLILFLGHCCQAPAIGHCCQDPAIVFGHSFQAPAIVFGHFFQAPAIVFGFCRKAPSHYVWAVLPSPSYRVWALLPGPSYRVWGQNMWLFSW